MHYVDGFVVAVEQAKKEQYIAYAIDMAEVFKEYGAISVVECWEDDVPAGEVTSFEMAVQRKATEAVCFSWITWPSKEVRQASWDKLMADPRMNPEDNPMPFDGKRMIYGGFQMVVNR